MCFVKCVDFNKYEEEYESTFSNGSMSLTQASSSIVKCRLAGHPKIVPDSILVMVSC